eukprot:m51a1_g739 hypothetical protein (222) ;mRNA; r:494398-495063
MADDDLMPRAFTIEGELAPDAGPPQDGFDYLRQVRWEAQRVPSVVVARVKPETLRSFDTRQTLFAPSRPAPARSPRSAPTPAHAAWERAFLKSFVQLRARLCEVDGCPPGLPENAAEWGAHCRSCEPSAAQAAGMDHVSATRLLARLCQSEGDPVPVAKWLVAALARVDEHVDADTGAVLRSLLLSCRARRTEVQPGQLAPELDMLAAIAGKFFGQEAPDD